MTAKEYLKSIRHLDKQIDAKLEQASRLRARAERMTTTFSPTKGFGRMVGGSTADSIDKLIDLEREINAMVDELVDEKRAVIAAIQAMPDERYARILELRYLNGYSWDQIAALMPRYERRQIFRLHGLALQNFEIPPKCHQISL